MGRKKVKPAHLWLDLFDHCAEASSSPGGKEENTGAASKLSDRLTMGSVEVTSIDPSDGLPQSFQQPANLRLHVLAQPTNTREDQPREQRPIVVRVDEVGRACSAWCEASQIAWTGPGRSAMTSPTGTKPSRLRAMPYSPMFPG